MGVPIQHLPAYIYYKSQYGTTQIQNDSRNFNVHIMIKQYQQNIILMPKIVRNMLGTGQYL